MGESFVFSAKIYLVPSSDAETLHKYVTVLPKVHVTLLEHVPHDLLLCCFPVHVAIKAPGRMT
jgi:hypothetical protein